MTLPPPPVFWWERPLWATDEDAWGRAVAEVVALDPSNSDHPAAPRCADVRRPVLCDPSLILMIPEAPRRRRSHEERVARAATWLDLGRAPVVPVTPPLDETRR